MPYRKPIRRTHLQHQLPAMDRHMQTATLNERGVTLLDRSLVFVPPPPCVLDAAARGATPRLSLHVAMQSRVGFRFSLDAREKQTAAPLGRFQTCRLALPLQPQLLPMLRA